MIDNFFNKHKGARRVALFWSMGLITFVVYRVTDPAILTKLDGASSSVVIAMIGILTTVIGFYQWHRSLDVKKDG